uniref:Uncharacterized protein n=1 Tax=viral metagenome TaxID=1070528 RepID=A0A6M3XBG9_9ZZZZ
MLPTPVARNSRCDAWSPAHEKRNSPDLDAVVSRALLPTPIKGLGGGAYGNGSPKLTTTIRDKLLPTPVLTSNFNRAGLTEKSGDGLGTVVMDILHPTPLATPADRGFMAAGGKSGRAAMKKLYPQGLPRSSASPRRLGSAGARALLSITEWLMGYDPGWLASAFPPTATLSSRTSRKPSAE